MIIETVLYGKIETPNTKEEIQTELENEKKRLLDYYCGYRQARVDALEEALDRLRREHDV